jgi:Flp pilus assembly protein TadB
VGALLGLAFGLGVLCMVRAASAPRAPSRRLATWRRRHAERLHQAGIDGVGPVGFVAVQLGVAFACGVGVFAITGIATIAACFGVLAVGLPPRIVARLVRRRRARLRQV